MCGARLDRALQSPKGSAMKQHDAARGKPWDIAVNSL
jgi:hypothetical protein